MNLTIDKEFHELIPSLSKEEYEGLEKSLLEEGCRDAVVIWNDLVIDGHNRFEICQKHSISFNTIKKEFATKDEAKIWIIKNQFGRRNLPAYERARLVLKIQDIIGTKAKEKKLSTLKKGNELPDTQIFGEREPFETNEELGKLANLSDETIRKVKIIEEKATPEVKDKLKGGDISIHGAYEQIKGKTKKIISKDLIFYIDAHNLLEATIYGSECPYCKKSLNVSIGPTFKPKKIKPTPFDKTKTLEINLDECIECGTCIFECQNGCFEETNDYDIKLNLENCKRCGRCIPNCPAEAIKIVPLK